MVALRDGACRSGVFGPEDCSVEGIFIMTWNVLSQPTYELKYGFLVP